MYEESLRIPFIVRLAQEIAPGTVNPGQILYVGFVPPCLDLAGVVVPDEMMHKARHNVYAHDGIRTLQQKAIA